MRNNPNCGAWFTYTWIDAKLVPQNHENEYGLALPMRALGDNTRWSGCSPGTRDLDSEVNEADESAKLLPSVVHVALQGVNVCTFPSRNIFSNAFPFIPFDNAPWDTVTSGASAATTSTFTCEDDALVASKTVTAIRFVVPAASADDA